MLTIFLQFVRLPTPVSPLFPSATATRIDSLCRLGGTPGPESLQNTAKNNFCALGAAGPITIQQIQTSVQSNNAISFGNPDTHPLSAQPGPMTKRAPLQALDEGKPVVLQGFVLAAPQEGQESVNCGKNVRRDCREGTPNGPRHRATDVRFQPHALCRRSGG
jgi:hypothetical protein